MASTILVPGCENLNEITAKQIESQMKEKYGKDFVVTAIGDRFNSDIATAYVNASDDDTLSFIVKVDTKGELVIDHYSYRLVCRKAENVIKEAFSKENINTECFVNFNKAKYDAPIDCTIEQYLKESGAVKAYVDIVCAESDLLDGKTIGKIFKAFSSEMPELEIYTQLYFVTDDEFEKIHVQIQKETESFDTYRLAELGVKEPVSFAYLGVVNGELTKDADEIDKVLNKGGE